MESIVDANPDFAGLNPTLRDLVRESETGLREIMDTLLAALPEPLRPYLERIVEEMPQKLLLNQLEFYKEMDRMTQRLEAHRETHQRLLAGNPAALPKQ
jgi:hypothetical protein